MNNILIRPAKERDTKAISRAFKKVYLPLFKEQKLSPETIKEMYILNSPDQISSRIKSNYFFIAEDKKLNKIIGFIGLKKNDGSLLHNRISTFFILKRYRGQGIGNLLFNKVLNLANKFKVNKLVVNSSFFAEKIYVHWGFKRIKIISKNYQNGDVYKNVWMEKTLEKK